MEAGQWSINAGSIVKTGYTYLPSTSYRHYSNTTVENKIISNLASVRLDSWKFRVSNFFCWTKYVLNAIKITETFVVWCFTMLWEHVYSYSCHKLYSSTQPLSPRPYITIILVSFCRMQSLCMKLVTSLQYTSYVVHIQSKLILLLHFTFRA